MYGKIRTGIILLFFISLSLLSPSELRSEFYKYIDEDGNIYFVDDKAKIPLKYKDQTKVYKENFDLASVAKVVIIAAENEDQIAHHILLEESEELVHHINTMMKKMGTIELRVSFAGSLISNDNIYSDILRNKINTSLPSIKIVEPKHSPIEGAILLAKEMMND